jgi:hypothetical protein
LFCHNNLLGILLHIRSVGLSLSFLLINNILFCGSICSLLINEVFNDRRYIFFQSNLIFPCGFMIFPLHFVLHAFCFRFTFSLFYDSYNLIGLLFILALYFWWSRLKNWGLSLLWSELNWGRFLFLIINCEIVIDFLLEGIIVSWDFLLNLSGNR